MAKKKFLGALVASSLVAGCAEMKELDDWAMKKARESSANAAEPHAISNFKVPTDARCRFNPGYLEADNCCIMRAYTSGLDVDVAFSRVAQEYGFSRKGVRDPGPYGSLDRGQLYDTYPGSYYRISGEVRPRSDSQLSQGVWIGLQIAKTMEGRTEVEPTYCEIPGRRMPDQAVWHKAVQDSIHAVLPPYPPYHGRRP